MKKRAKETPWGNSILFINLKYWTCAYCGKLIRDHKPFSIVLINANPSPYVLCSRNCFKILVIKLEAERGDKDSRPWRPTLKT